MKEKKTYKTKQLTQEKINDWFKKPLMRLSNAAKVLGISRQQIRMITLTRQYIPYERIDGVYYAKTDDVLKYALSQKKKWLEKASKIKLPDNF